MDMQNVAKLEIPEGEVRTINGSNGDLIWGKISYDVKYLGDGSQNGTPSPSSPIQIKTVAGSNTFTISANTKSKDYTVTLRSASYPADGTATSNGCSASYSSGTATVNRESSSSSNSFLRRPLSASFTVHKGEQFTIFANNPATIGSASSAAPYMAVRLNDGSSDDNSTEVYLGTVNASNTFTATKDKTYPTITFRVSKDLAPSNFILSPIVEYSIELCKVGDYQDYIYKNNGKWYKHREINKIVLDGSESWSVANTGTDNWYYSVSNLNQNTPGEGPGYLLCSHYPAAQVYNSNTKQGICITKASKAIRIRYGAEDTVENFKSWLSSNNVSIYYVLATAAEDEIANPDLIAQLDNIHQWLTRYGYSSQVSGDLPIIIDKIAL